MSHVGAGGSVLPGSDPVRCSWGTWSWLVCTTLCSTNCGLGYAVLTAAGNRTSMFHVTVGVHIGLHIMLCC